MSSFGRGRAAAARVLGVTLLGVLAAGALLLDPPTAPRITALSLAPARDTASVPLHLPLATAHVSWEEHTDTLRKGETIVALLARSGLSRAAADSALRAIPGFNARRARAGTSFVLGRPAGDSAPVEIVFRPAIDSLVRMRRTEAGWSGSSAELPWTVDTLVVRGEIASSLYAALNSSATSLTERARTELAWTIADIYEYRVDMSRELHRGDDFSVLFERSTTPNGTMRIGRVLAVRFELSGAVHEAIRFTGTGGRTEYYDQRGRSLRAAFLRAPLEFRRVSSVFGMRRHPILRVWRRHRGTDYAARAGTPVRAIGDGRVIFAGRKGGYGNVVEIRHRNGLVSRYGHLRGFTSAARSGRTVTIGQSVGFVGATGLATAPHLHFEILVNGVHRDPRTALSRRDGRPVASSDRERFSAARAMLLVALDGSDSSSSAVSALP